MSRSLTARRPPYPATGSSSPFAGAGIGVAFALAATVAALTWRLFPGSLPGGRWPAVHLFTLGAVTPLIATFMPRFASALLHARPAGSRPELIRILVVAAGAGLTIGGRLTGITSLLAAGGSSLSAAVVWLYVDLRHERRRALPSRFGFVVRAYERACGAFIHGALLGVLLGAGVFGGAWYGAARAAHLQLMLLGWGGLTLLATSVMFGPAVMRARIEEGADAAAARALPNAATALSVSALALLGSGLGGPAGTAARYLAGAGLAVYGWSVIRIFVPILRTAARSTRTAARSFMAAAAAWFILAAAFDCASILAGKPEWTDAAAIALLVGVLLHAILATMTYVLPLILGVDAATRGRIGEELAALPRARMIALSMGAALVAAATASPSRLASDVARSGWLLVAASVAVTCGLFVTAAVGTSSTPRPRGSAIRDQRGA